MIFTKQLGPLGGQTKTHCLNYWSDESLGVIFIKLYDSEN